MEMEMVDGQGLEAATAEHMHATADEGLRSTLERLVVALEQVTERLNRTETVTATGEAELERRLMAAELRLATLAGDGGVRSETKVTARKTVPASVTHLLAKQGVQLEAMGGESIQAGALDAALASLSLEQRIAVKAQLMRTGVLG